MHVSDRLRTTDPSTRRPVTSVPSPATVSKLVTGLTLTVAFTLLALDVESFWVVFVVGFGGVLPTAVGVAARRQAKRDTSEGNGEQTTTQARLQDLRMQYVNGELTEAEFERRVGQLLAPASDREQQSAARLTRSAQRHD